jgi:antitoxin component YwqK of YwqJK toxin-antitoxin module
MSLKIFITASLLAISAMAVSQNSPDINKTDPQGKKQGRWIKKYPNNTVMYDGFFKDDHPVGEFKRYDDDNSLKSILIYSEDGKTAEATLFHYNGYISSKGRYVNQKKEGKWQFFSQFVNGYLVSEETYTGNLRNGISLKFYPDSTIAEKVNYVNDIRQGEWIQNYPNGAKCLKSNYLNGQINGKFEFWFDNGKLEFSGYYKNDARDGQWLIYNYDGTIKYKIEYHNGYTIDRQLDIDESDRLDSLEKNKGKIADPEKSGYIMK